MGQSSEMDRRAFVQLGAAGVAGALVVGLGGGVGLRQPGGGAGGAGGAGGGPEESPAPKAADPGPKPPAIPARDPRLGEVKHAEKRLKILVLGGTVFLGPHCVEYAVARGHEVTLFNRQKTNPAMFSELARLKGDRNNDVASLKAAVEKGARWDAVIDTSAMFPRQIKLTGEVLREAAKRYLLVSTINAYKGNTVENEDEDGPLGDALVEDGKEENLENYGPYKVLCEREVAGMFPGRWAAVRPALIVGPRDPSDRFTYWPVRLRDAVGDRSEVLCPGPKDQTVQFIDVRDLARFMVTLIEREKVGAHNGVGPCEAMTMERMVSEVAQGAGRKIGEGGASLKWAEPEALLGQGVKPWSDLPVWVPQLPGYEAMHKRSNARSLAAGLVCRPLAETSRDILEWFPRELERRRITTPWVKQQALFEGRPEPKMPDPMVSRAGLTAERERAVLAALREGAAPAPAAPEGEPIKT